MFQIRISGGIELAMALRDLADLTSDRRAVTALKDGMVRASQPMAVMANQLAPSDAKGADRIQVVASKKLTARQRKAARKESKDRILTYVGERGGSTIGMLNEFGTAERRLASGKSVGAITPHPFMRPSVEATAAQVLHGMVPAVREVITKRAKAVHRKHARLAKRAANLEKMRADALQRSWDMHVASRGGA